MAAGDVSRLSIVGRFQAQNICNTLHYYHSAQTLDEDIILERLVAAWDTNIKTAWVTRHSDDYNLVGITAFKQAGEPKVPAFRRLEAPGLVTGTPQPALLSRVITLYTESTNHRRRGRVQLSGSELLQFNEDDGAVADAEIVLMRVLADLLMEPLVDTLEEFKLCIPANLTEPYELVTAVRARSTPGVMRSRRVKGYSIG